MRRPSEAVFGLDRVVIVDDQGRTVYITYLDWIHIVKQWNNLIGENSEYLNAIQTYVGYGKETQ
jgi:hypothetical protein